MKFNRSDDGIDRATVILRIRLEPGEIEIAKKISKQNRGTKKEWRQVLSSFASLAIENEIDNFSSEQSDEVCGV